MIASSPLAKALAAAVALALHGGALLVLGLPPATVPQGGLADGPELALGSSFADMARGVASPRPAEGAAQPVTAQPAARATTPETARPAAATVAERSTGRPAVTAARPGTASSPGQARLSDRVAAAPAPVAPTASRPAQPTIARPDPMRPATAQPAPAGPGPNRPATLQPATPRAAQPARPTPAPGAPAPRPVTALADSAAPERSLRPQGRPAEPPPPPRATPRAAPPPPAGNAARDARAGQADGRQGGASVSAGRAEGAQTATSAAAARYPAAVMARLARVRRPAVSAPGSAVVVFGVGPGGGLSAASVARSSGSRALDQAALQLVRRAAPFPAPPAGAQRRFSITIAGR